ncbi:MAG: hypothetical protein Q9183_002545 [Haloplaca sp. 2 TL-2023]
MLRWILPEQLLQASKNDFVDDAKDADILAKPLDLDSLFHADPMKTQWIIPLQVQTFLQNASKIHGVAAGTVHCTLLALCIPLGLLRDLMRRNPDAADSRPRDADLDELGILRESDFRYILELAFRNFEQSLYKTVNGAGTAICVSIFIVFVITGALQELGQRFNLPVPHTTAAEDVLRALFGLLSVTYRNIGILNTLQQFTEQELKPSSDEPGLDIIEAAQDLLSMRISEPKQNAPGSWSDYTQSTDPKRLLAPDYYVRPRPHDFFCEGRVFSILHTEGTSSSSTYSGFSEVPFNEMAYSQIRIFVVIKARPEEYYCLCIPITTYRGRATAKKGIDPKVHAIIYTSSHPPAPLLFEPSLQKKPIRVIASRPENVLDPLSRVNLAKVYPIEWNRKVKDIGRVDVNDRARLRAYWESAMLS